MSKLKLLNKIIVKYPETPWLIDTKNIIMYS